MSSVSNSDASPEANSSSPEATDAPTNEDDTSSSLTDKLDTAATAIRVSFLVFVVVFTLIPVVGLLAGWAPFDPPPKLPYFALVGLAFVGTIALVAAELSDV